MAKLIDPLAQERPVPRLTGEVARRQAVLPAEGVGRGMQMLGQGMQAAADEITRVQKVEEERVNTLAAEDAFTRLRERQLGLSVGEAGFGSVKGRDAVTRPVFKEYSERFDAVEKEIADGLRNDTQRLKFKQRAQVSRLQFQEEMLRHLAQQGDVFSREVYDGVVTTEQRNAMARWNSPNDIGLSLDRIRDAVATRADRFGWDPEYAKAVLQAEHGKVHASVVQQALLAENYQYAEAWFNEHRSDIDLQTARALESAVENGTQKQLTAGYTADYLANEDSLPALGGLHRRVLEDATLDETRKNILVGRIQNRMAVLERRIELEAERRFRMVERGISQLNDITLMGFEPSLDAFSQVLELARGTPLEAEAHAALRLADATRQFRNMPPLHQEQMLTAAEAQARLDPTKFDVRVLHAWRQIREAQQRQVQEAPVSFAVQQGIIPPPAPLDLSQPDQMGTALQERFTVARTMASRYQTPMKPLTPAEVQLLTATLSKASVDQKRNYIAALFKASGGDTEGYLAVMGQLAPDDPVTAIAGAQAARGRMPDADLLLRGQAILNPPKTTDGKTTGLLPMPPENELREQFDRYVRDVFARKPEARNAHYQAAKAAYAALSADAGDRDTKVLQNDRWEAAMEAAIGQVAVHNDRRIVLPSGYDVSRFRDELRERLDAIAVSQALDPSWTASRLRDLPLENLGESRYVLRSGDAVVTDPTGKPLILDFSRPYTSRVAGGQVSRPAPLPPAGPGLPPSPTQNPVVPRGTAPQPQGGLPPTPKPVKPPAPPVDEDNEAERSAKRLRDIRAREAEIEERLKQLDKEQKERDKKKPRGGGI